MTQTSFHVIFPLLPWLNSSFCTTSMLPANSTFEEPHLKKEMGPHMSFTDKKCIENIKVHDPKKKSYIYRHGTIEHKETCACKSSLRPTTFTNTWVISLKRLAKQRGKHVVAKLQWSIGEKSSRMDGKNVFVIGCMWPSQGWSNTQWQWIWNRHPFRLWNVLWSLNTVPTGALNQWL